MKTALRQRLRIKTGCLLLHRTERTADRDGSHFSAGVLRYVQIGGKRNAVAIDEGDLGVLHLGASRKHLIPFGLKLQRLDFDG